MPRASALDALPFLQGRDNVKKTCKNSQQFSRINPNEWKDGILQVQLCYPLLCEHLESLRFPQGKSQIFLLVVTSPCVCSAPSVAAGKCQVWCVVWEPGEGSGHSQEDCHGKWSSNAPGKTGDFQAGTCRSQAPPELGNWGGFVRKSSIFCSILVSQPGMKKTFDDLGLFPTEEELISHLEVKSSFKMGVNVI